MKDSTSNQGPHHSFINKMKQIKDTLYDKVAGNFMTSMTKPDSKIMKANIKTFYEHKRFIEIDMRNPCMGVSGTDGAIEGAKEDRTRQLVELQNDLTESIRTASTTSFKHGSLSDFFSNYLSKIDVGIKHWKLMHSCRRDSDSDYKRELWKYAMSCHSRTLPLYITFCELLIQIYKDDIWATFSFSHRDIPVPLLVSSSTSYE